MPAETHCQPWARSFPGWICLNRLKMPPEAGLPALGTGWRRSCPLPSRTIKLVSAEVRSLHPQPQGLRSAQPHCHTQQASHQRPPLHTVLCSTNGRSSAVRPRVSRGRLRAPHHPSSFQIAIPTVPGKETGVPPGPGSGWRHSPAAPRQMTEKRQFTSHYPSLPGMPQLVKPARKRLSDCS